MSSLIPETSCTDSLHLAVKGSQKRAGTIHSVAECKKDNDVKKTNPGVLRKGDVMLQFLLQRVQCIEVCRSVFRAVSYSTL